MQQRTVAGWLTVLGRIQKTVVGQHALHPSPGRGVVTDLVSSATGSCPPDSCCRGPALAPCRAACALRREDLSLPRAKAWIAPELISCYHIPQFLAATKQQHRARAELLLEHQGLDLASPETRSSLGVANPHQQGGVCAGARSCTARTTAAV